MSCSPALAHQQNLFMDLDYGNCRAMETVEKQTTFSHRSHSAWKTRQPLASFPQFPQSLLLVQHKSKKPNQLIALTNYSCTSNLNRRFLIFHVVRSRTAQWIKQPSRTPPAEVHLQHLRCMATQRGRARNYLCKTSCFPLATLPSLFDPLRRPSTLPSPGY